MPTEKSPNDPPPPEEQARPRTWYGVWLPRVAMVALIALAVVSVATSVFEASANFLVTLLISVFVAFALLPAVEALAKRGWRRGAATGLVMVAGAIAVVLFVLALTQVVVGQVLRLIERAPEYLEEISGWLDESFGIQFSVDDIVAQLEDDRDRLTDLASDAVGGILGLATTTLGMVFQGLTVALFVFYILADLPKLREATLRRFPPAQQVHIDTVTTITIEKVGGYVYSRLLLALISTVYHFAVFTLIGLPYAFAMAAWVGLVSQFIPTVGTYLAGALPVLIALLEDPIDAVWVIVAVIVYQQVENYLISPKVTANTMNIHPAVAFGSVILGAALLGGVGALLALPAAAVVAALISAYTDQFEVIDSPTIESSDAYAGRLQSRAEEKDRKWSDRKERIKSTVERLHDDLTGDDTAAEDTAAEDTAAEPSDDPPAGGST